MSAGKVTENKINPNRNHIENSGLCGKLLVLCQNPGTINELMAIEYHHGYRILLGIWHCVL